MAQNLDPQTAGLDLAPQVWQVPKLGMMEMQIQEYKDQQASKKAAGAQKLVGDIDLKNVHPAHLADLQKKLDVLYDVAVQAYSSKDPALMKQLQAKKNELNIFYARLSLWLIENNFSMKPFTTAGMIGNIL